MTPVLEKQESVKFVKLAGKSQLKEPVSQRPAKIVNQECTPATMWAPVLLATNPARPVLVQNIQTALLVTQITAYMFHLVWRHVPLVHILLQQLTPASPVPTAVPPVKIRDAPAVSLATIF